MKPAPQTTEGHPGNWQAATAGTYKARRSSSSKVRASSAGPCQPALSCSEPSRAEPYPNPLRPPGPAPAPERNSRGAAPGSSRARYANQRPPIGCSARRERRFPEGAGPSGAEGRLWGTWSPGGGGAARLRAATSAWGQPQLGVSPFKHCCVEALQAPGFILRPSVRESCPFATRSAERVRFISLMTAKLSPSPQ